MFINWYFSQVRCQGHYLDYFMSVSQLQFTLHMLLSVVKRWCYRGGLATTHWAQHSVAMLEQRGQYMKAEIWDFPVMAEQTKLIISYLLYGFFIMDPSLRSIKTNNWSASPQWVLHLSPRYSQVTLVRGYPFWQLSIDNNVDVHKDVYYQVKNRLYMPWTPSQ